jgi:predicted nucleic-acid-binding protein
VKYSLDTNVILRFLLGDVTEQTEKAIKIIQNLSDTFGVADLAFVELEYVLSKHYQFNRPQIVEIFIAFIRLPNINCNRSLLDKVLPEYLKYNNLSFTDIALASYAELNDYVPLLTFDQNLAKKISSARLL